MKKSLFFGLIAVFGLLGCTRNQEIDIQENNLTLFAITEIPAETKTVVEGGTHVYWEPGDEIMVFSGEKSAKFTTDITASVASATFKGTFGEDAWPEDLDLWAVYPYSEDAVFDGETITTTLPSEQVARPGSFGKDLNLAIAHSNSNTLQFYNVGGGIRFSVTEDGIKKVMFEGLGGEMISGKVKIGFSEDGKPKVQEVSGGSQFITLLPPSGQETFEKDTWYYIVAIPGALEKGYKLRFYKDTDYARKVSEKAVEIKRSIFGNIEKADEGVDYEATTTHFPETEEECKESIEFTDAIQKEVFSILWGDGDKEVSDIEAIIEEISRVEGVIYVDKNTEGTCISVVQKDSICVNYLLYNPFSGFEDTSELNALPTLQMPSRSHSSNSNANTSFKDGKKALVLAPFQRDFNKRIESVWIPELSKNYSSDNILYLPDSKAGVFQFKEELSKQYDFILIDTHGVTGKEYKITPSLKTENAFLATATPYNLEVAWQIVSSGDMSKDELAVVETPKGDRYIAINPNFLEDVSYNDNCVIITACESAKMLNNAIPWFDAFTSKGSCVVSGATVSMDKGVLGPMADHLIEVMTLGCSFRDAFRYVAKSQRMRDYCNAVYEINNGNFSSYDICNNYIYRQNEDKPTLDFFLTSPIALLNSPVINAENTSLSWNASPQSFPATVSIATSAIEHDGTWSKQYEPITFNQTFEVYVDGMMVSTSCFESGDNSKQTITIPTPSIGPHSWRVITNIIEVDSGITRGSYASEEGHFTVTEQKPDPPLVETYPASVDSEKVFLSGTVTNRSQEGLETGFYYYKLTAQEEAMQLSENDKVRLVLGGEKILSAGDYKDYFGVDLKDFVQSSTYLFVAYATDEYDQTGRGAVLSFKTGSPSVSVSSVSLDKTRLELTVGSAATLVATVLPENATNKKVTWSSSDESIATVSSVGVVTGISKGDAVITVTTEDGRKTATCNVTVITSTIHVESVSLNKTSLELTVGNTATLVATVLPENAANKSVTWSSSNASKATVSSSGVVTGVAEGNAVITATTVDGGKTASCNVTVRQAATSEPKLSVSTRRLDFGDQVKFTQESRNITITNSGTGTLQITSISKTSNYGDLFQLSGWTSGGSIAAGASKTLTVSFQPLEERYYEETLTIVSSNSVGDKSVTVTLCGTGIPEAEDAVIQLSADELSWGDVEVGESVTKSFSVKNTGTTALTISSIKVVATDNTVNPSYFAISPNESTTVSPGNSKAFNVAFAPESVGGYNAIVSIKSNAKNATQGTSTVWLSGEGVAATSKVLTASPSSLSFGYQTIGNRTHKNFTVTNTGTKAVTLYSMVATDGFDVDQTWAEGNSLGLAAGASKTFSAYFTPTQAKSYSGKITIKSNASNGDLVIPLSGAGVEAQGYLEIVSGESLDFGNVNVGTSGTLYTKIQNTGEAPLNILGITCSEGFSASCNTTSLKEGYKTSISISFTPTQAKAYRGSVIVNTDAENGSVSIDVSGTGKQSSTGNTFVDMGLSVRWASANVGASNPEEFGHYVAWAETATKTQYLEKNYKYYNADTIYSGEGFITKYCSNPSYGYRGYYDSLKMLTYEDDYAQTRLGGLARIPTRKEWEELKSNCTWFWTSQNGVNGYLVTSNINGNVIFLPAGGRIEYSNDDVNSVGYYWTSNLYHDDTYAHTWELRADKAWYSHRERYKGLTVRAVEDYSAKPMIYTETTSLNFEGVKLGTTASKKVTIQNTGKGTLHISEIRSTKRISFDWTSASVAPGASKVLTVYYTPVKDPDLVIDDPNTWDMTTMTISSDARNDSDYILYIKGYGVANNGNIEGTEEDPWN